MPANRRLRDGVQLFALLMVFGVVLGLASNRPNINALGLALLAVVVALGVAVVVVVGRLQRKRSDE